MQPYNQIFFDKLDEFLTKPDIDNLQKQNKIECIPLGFSRGLSWEGKLIIVDEAASLTFDDIILLLTRCAEHTKIFFIGDSLNQNDIGAKSGFRKMFDLLSDEESQAAGIRTFSLQKEEDILRSGFVRFIMKKTGKIKV
jgi:predicted ribonuclease YlaK